ncbi:hypothetical protein AQZ49_01765 [Novosphingobium sp. FSW06-99]|nr:hypothetical protein AQZ49_01765 [Novosphingobium sp. FSW06-99]
MSVDAALARIAGHIPGGFAEMARIVDRNERLVRKWGDPECRERMPIEDAIALDLAYRAAGGDGAPIFEAYAAKLNHAGTDFFADQIALSRYAVTLIKECSEAEAAVVLAAQPGATARDRAEATREIEEAIAVLNRTRLMLGALPVRSMTEQAVAS